MGRRSVIEERCRANTGMSVAQFVRLNMTGRTTQAYLSGRIGVRIGSLQYWLNKHAIPWGRNPAEGVVAYYAVTINGITDTRRAHCTRVGVPYSSVTRVRRDHGLTFPEALALVVTKSAGRRDGCIIHNVRGHTGTRREICDTLGLHLRRVERIQGDYGLSFAEAVEIALSRINR